MLNQQTTKLAGIGPLPINPGMVLSSNRGLDTLLNWEPDLS